MGDNSLSMAGGNVDAVNVLDIYPVNHYYFGSKEALHLREETLAHRIQRLKLKLNCSNIHIYYYCKYRIPCSSFQVVVVGMVNQLSSKLSMNEDDSWEVGECIGMWWRADFETLIYPFMPPDIKRPKECTKLFLVRLPESRKFIVLKNLKLLPVPLCQVHENFKTCGPIIAEVPQLLSKFSYNTTDSV